MAENKNVIEDTLIQISNLEESLNKNAQGILASTMKEEINNLVKESLKEEDEVDFMEVDTDEVDTDNMDDVDDEEVEDIEGDVEFEEEPMAMTPPMDSEEYDDDVVDMTQASDAELIKVFKAMDSDDGIIVQKDDNMLSIKDNETDSEYIVQLSESELEEFEFEDELDGFDLDDFDFEDLDMRKIDMGIEDKGMLNLDPRKDEFDSKKRKKRRKKIKEDEIAFEDDFDLKEFMEELQDDGTPMPPESKEEMEENIYELELGEMMHDTTMESEMFPEKMEGNVYEMDDIDEMEMLEYEMEEGDHMEGEIEEKDCMEGDCNEEDVVMEGKKMFTGHGAGHVSFKGVNEDKPKKMKEGTKVPKNSGKKKGKGKGYDFEVTVNGEGFTQKVETKEGKVKLRKKKETNEASRTNSSVTSKNAGMKGAKKGRTNRNKTRRSVRKATNESINNEVNLLREKNEEYKKALNLFRNKLNEVAIFNSNLAYATRLFTEHSTTKQEKINILRRFDNVETLKESKTLYRSIKNELGSEKPMENTINESIQRTVQKTPSNGSAVNLIESKTYENPQFLRMKDLMTKIK